MIGGILVKLAFLSCAASVICYFQHHRRQDASMLKYGRLLYHATVTTVLLISATLLYLILTHQFQYTYVWSYSSRDLSTPLLISTFYAGQEGSFLLWTLYTAIIGIFLLQYSSRKGYESQVMTVYGLIHLMLLLMLIVKNPFTYVWETWPDQVEAGFVPANGRGLNPLLQNYWMVIHPQILFSGFSAMAVPYAYVVAAMMKRDYTNWIRPATPWVVFGALQLGTGIMMGGYWAYETLGWGGYWGWDPVENSSLVPWLVSVGLIHTILSQRKNGSFVRTNLVLGMLCFILVLYSTFLTRSGVLGDTSVHSFVDPGMWAYWMLVGVIVLFIAIGFGLFVVRLREMPKPVVQHDYVSREFALFLASAALVCVAIFVVVGTSAPIITGILQGKVTAVDISYYVTTTLPLGIFIGLLSGIGQLLWWTRSSKRELLKNIMVPAIVAALFTIGMTFFGLSDLLAGLFVYGAAFALSANAQVGWRIIRGNPKYAGGSIAHVGLAVMFLGFVSSSKYDEKQTVSLTEGLPVDALGYRMTFTGHQPIGNEKFAFNIMVEKDGRPYRVSPIMYHSSYNDGLMRNPDIVNLFTKDLYVAPLSLERKDQSETSPVRKARIRKGESRQLGDLQVKFVDFEFPVMEKAAMLEGKEVRIGARLEIVGPEGKKQTVTPYQLIKDGEATNLPTRYADTYDVLLLSMKPNQETPDSSSVEVGITELAAGNAGPNKDVLVVEASIKPAINLVWTGVILLLVGFIVTIYRRSQEAAYTRHIT